MLVVAATGEDFIKETVLQLIEGNILLVKMITQTAQTNDIFTHLPGLISVCSKRNCLKPIISKNHSAFCNVNHRKIGTMPPMILFHLPAIFIKQRVQAGNLDFIHYFAVANEGNAIE